MLATCYLKAEGHPDTKAFEKAPATRLKVCSTYLLLDYLIFSNYELAINWSNPMEDIANQVIVNFGEDSQNPVSLATARALMTITGAPSLKAFIHQSLVEYRKVMEIGFPQDDTVSTSEHWTEIARQYPKGLHLKTNFCEIDQQVDNKSFAEMEISLQKLMSGVTKENKHERISFGPLVGRELL